MKRIMECLICEKELYSEFGMGCKLCGMPLEGEDEFCCDNCIEKYKVIRRFDIE